MRVIQLEHLAILDNLLSDMYVRNEQHARSTFVVDMAFLCSKFHNFHRSDSGLVCWT